jgi:hypothetical protein
MIDFTPEPEDTTICPRCGSSDFREVDCGPDSYEDDIAYSSDICNSCGLWHSGWTGKWLVDVKSWVEEEEAEEYE